MRSKDNPDKPEHDKVPAALDDKTMHACLRIAVSEIMMSDGMRTGPPDFQCMLLSLAAPNEAEAERLFHAMAKDGHHPDAFRQVVLLPTLRRRRRQVWCLVDGHRATEGVSPIHCNDEWHESWLTEQKVFREPLLGAAGDPFAHG
jgi:hypothetical protein